MHMYNRIRVSRFRSTYLQFFTAMKRFKIQVMVEAMMTAFASNSWVRKGMLIIPAPNPPTAPSTLDANNMDT